MSKPEFPSDNSPQLASVACRIVRVSIGIRDSDFVIAANGFGAGSSRLTTVVPTLCYSMSETSPSR